MLNERPIIAVAGSLGAGKSTLAELLALKLGYPFLPEEFATNPHMVDYYAGRANFLQVEEWFIAHDFGRQQRAMQLLDSGAKGVVLDKPGAGNHAWVDIAPMPDDQKHYCHDLIRAQAARLPISLLLDLRASEDVLLERIHLRGREMEQGLTTEFFVALNRAHVANEREWGDTPRIVVSTDRCNFITQPELVDRLANRVGDVLAGRHPRISVFS